MPRDGSGTFNRTDGTRTGAQVWQDANSASVDIEPDDHDTHDEDIGDALTGSLAIDGQSTMTGALKMGSQKITGLAVGTAATDGATFRQTTRYATESGVADAYVISPAPTPTTGEGFRWKPGNTNTGASTLNTTAVVSADGFALTGGELAAGRLVESVYDGTNHVLREVKDTLVMVDTDAGATFGPVINLKRVSASPANADEIGAFQFYGEDDGGNETVYAQIKSSAKDVTDGAEEGELEFTVQDGTGSLLSKMFITDTEVQLADNGAGATAAPALTLRRASASPSDDDLGGYISSAMNNSAAARIEYGRIQGQALDVTAATEDGAWLIQAMVAGTLTEFIKVGLDATSASAIQMTADGNAVIRVDRLTNDGELVQFAQAGTKEGNISVSGGTVSYNGYLLTHWSQWCEGLAPDDLVPKGTLLSTVDELVTRANGEPDPNHVRVKITSDLACRRVYGVFGGVDEDGHVVVDAAGAGLVRVRGPVEGGDLLMASGEPGVACVQHDDLWKTHTIGKANMGYDGTGEALLPVALRAS